MAKLQYQALGPLLAGEGSRAFLGLEVRDDGSADAVVLVWVPEDAEKDPALLNRIRRETEHAAKLDHPNIVKVHGFAKLDEGHARVVEFADAESLRKLLEAARRLPPRFAAKIVADAAMGLHYAHVAGNDDGSPLVHGDMRPETLLIGFNGVVKVTGYGALAFAPREMGGQRVRGRRVHTAPEQIIGGREAFALQTDVYLLGITLHECLTGKVPFAEQGDFFDHAVLTLPLPPPTPGEVPEELQKIIDKACAKRIPDRYPTPLAFREAIVEAMGTLPTNEELAGFLKQWFPESDKARAGRRQAIDAGIADLARKQWADRKNTPSPTPAIAPAPQAAAVSAPSAPRPVPVEASAPRPIAAAPRPVSNPPAPRPIVPTMVPIPAEEPDPPPSKLPYVIGAAFILALVAGYIGIQKANEPVQLDDRPQTYKRGGGEAGTTAITPPIPVPTPSAEHDAGPTEPVDAVTPPPVVDAGAPPVVAPPPAPVDAGPPAPVATDGRLELESTPPLELKIEEKSYGRTPFKGVLPVGRKVLLLTSKELGIRTTRVVTIRPGETLTVNVSLGQGYVTLSAPEGAAVFIDERRIGNAPIRGEIPVYEGAHKVVVLVGKARWSENFNLASGQRMNFNVEQQ